MVLAYEDGDNSGQRSLQEDRHGPCIRGWGQLRSEVIKEAENNFELIVQVQIHENNCVNDLLCCQLLAKTVYKLYFPAYSE